MYLASPQAGLHYGSGAPRRRSETKGFLMIETIFNGILGFFNSLIDTGSTAAQGFVNTGSTAAEGVYGTVTGSLGDIVGAL